MKLQEMIKIQEGILGKKLEDAAKSEEQLAQLVQIIVDHQAEAMVEAYKIGVREAEDLKALMGKKNIPFLR